MANEIWFKRSDGIEIACEEGSEAFKLMSKDGAFTRTLADVQPPATAGGTDTSEPEETEELQAGSLRSDRGKKK